MARIEHAGCDELASARLLERFAGGRSLEQKIARGSYAHFRRGHDALLQFLGSPAIEAHGRMPASRDRRRRARCGPSGDAGGS